MATPEPLVLDGCTPTPLASYLKALGVLRLLSSPTNNVSGEAADPRARGWWENERFHLKTALTRDDVLRFFLEDYAPSPIIAPWNGRAGFLEGEEQESSTRTGADLMRRLEASPARRFANMRRTIERSRANDELARLNHLRAKTKALKKERETLQGEERKSQDEERRNAEKEEKQSKRVLLPALRSATEPEHVSYVDACYVLSTDEVPMPLLGSGGNDGSREFGVNFADELARLFELDDGSATEVGKSSLEGALFSGGRLGTHGTMGQFSPGQGGRNATTGYEGQNPLNPWDVVLAMEGTIAFAGALTRSWGAAGDSRASFPFTFEPLAAAAGNFSPEDPFRPRAEIWLPLWKKPVAFLEIAAIFSEGRLTVGGRTARTGLDAARSVAQIGLARGISSFERYSIIQPDSNKNMPYQATPLGRVATPDRPRRDLIVDLEAGDWLGRAQRLAGNRRAFPSRARHAMRRLEDSLFQMTDAARAPEGTRNALMAIGSFVDWLTANRKAREELAPPPRLSGEWIRQADDGTPEFRTAAALACLGLPPLALGGGPAPVSADGASETDPAPTSHDESPEQASRSPVMPALPMAAHFAPIDEGRFFGGTGLRRRRAWAADAPPTVVWGAGSLVSNLIAVLERRTVEATMRGLLDKPFAGAVAASAGDVAAFIHGDFDDARCAALLAGLIWAAPARLRGHASRDGAPVRKPPFAYAALKPIFSADAALRSAGALDGAAHLPMPPGLLARLRAGGGSQDGRATDEAVRAALSRARASGLASPFERVGSYGHPSSRFGAGVRADRLAASLLIPIRERELNGLLARVWPDALPDDDSHTEETTDAA